MTASVQIRPELPSRERPRRTSRGFLVWLAVGGTLCALIAAVAASAYVPPSVDGSRIPLRGTVHLALLFGHIATGFVALSIGALQFWPWLRSRYPAVHRGVGRTYFFAGVFPSAILGLPVVVLSVLGLPSIIPLGLLCVLWFATAVQGLRTARQRRFREHREWMIRNFALTAAAATGRLWGMLLFAVGEPFYADYEVLGRDVAWAANFLSWVVNLLIAEWYLQRRRKRAVGGTTGP